MEWLRTTLYRTQMERNNTIFYTTQLECCREPFLKCIDQTILKLFLQVFVSKYLRRFRCTGQVTCRITKQYSVCAFNRQSYCVTPSSCGNFSDISARRINLYVICRRFGSWTKIAVYWQIDTFRAARPACWWIARHLRWMEPFFASKPDAINHCNTVIRKRRNCSPLPNETRCAACVQLSAKPRRGFNVLPLPA